MEPKPPPGLSTRGLSRNETHSPLLGSSSGGSPKSKKTALYFNTRWLARTRLVTRPENTAVKDRRQFQKLPPFPTEAPRPPPLAEARLHRFNPLYWTTRSTTTTRSSISQLIRSFGGIKLKNKRTEALSRELEDIATTAAGPTSDFTGGESWSPIRRAWRRTSRSIPESPPSLPYPLETSSTSSSPSRFAPAVHVGQRSSDGSLDNPFVLLPPGTIKGGQAGLETFGNHDGENEPQGSVTG